MIGDIYKVEQLKKMLAHETQEGVKHYGAHLSHWYGDAKHLTIGEHPKVCVNLLCGVE